MADRFSMKKSIVRRWSLTGNRDDCGRCGADDADRRRERATGKHARGGRADANAGEPIMAIVSIKTQQVAFYDADGWILSAPVSTGVKGRETPAGVFAVIEKEAEHHSTLYDDASMPHMQRLTWNGIALHGGPLPGYAASHGCVRMPFGFAEKLFDKTRIGMRVIVSPNDATPVEFSHAALLVPNAEAVAAAPARAETLAREAEEAAKAADEAKKSAAAAAREAASIKASLRKLERLKSAADAELASPKRRSPRQRRTRPRRVPRSRRLKAAAKAAGAARNSTPPKPMRNRSSMPQPEQRMPPKRPRTGRRTLPRRRARQSSHSSRLPIYISRATQKLYVRRNTRKPWPDGGEVFDASIEVPVAISDPDRPIGTHVFTAMAPADAGLRWAAVTIDNGDDAKDALDRIAIPQDVLDRIAPTALPRSSIIVSDEPPSRETNYRTEFVAVLSNQPQGGFITRKPTVSLERALGERRLLQFLGAAQPLRAISQQPSARPRLSGETGPFLAVVTGRRASASWWRNRGFERSASRKRQSHWSDEPADVTVRACVPYSLH